MIMMSLIIFFCIGVIIHYSFHYLKTKGVTDISAISKPIFFIVDKMLKANYTDKSIHRTILNELAYLNACNSIIALKLYLESLYIGIPDRSYMERYNYIFIKRREFITFAETATGAYRTAILLLLEMQIKLKAVANYPDLAPGIKENLLFLARLAPTNKIELITTLYKIQCKCESYKLDYNTVQNIDIQRLFELLLNNLDKAECPYYENKSNVVSLYK